ncbi:hypothetical protein EYF80_033053 [Liparis tanakae]|uniref:Uncharacterized protein n=1 Tax=Liparis tanakae TaxID=230148 RepID=A0A4Z2GSR9_9TELE|nr:hypothetical protein EYF80_033053 [Liparis tanakae]
MADFGEILRNIGEFGLFQQISVFPVFERQKRGTRAERRDFGACGRRPSVLRNARGGVSSDLAQTPPAGPEMN